MQSRQTLSVLTGPTWLITELKIESMNSPTRVAQLHAKLQTLSQHLKNLDLFWDLLDPVRNFQVLGTPPTKISRLLTTQRQRDYQIPVAMLC